MDAKFLNATVVTCDDERRVMRNAGIPEDSRGALPGYGWLAKRFADQATVDRAEKIRPIAEELGCTMAQLAIAWCAANPRVTTVITGASKTSQVVDNFGALEVLEVLTPELIERINAAVARAH